jgi:hypothetical protein
MRIFDTYGRGLVLRPLYFTQRRLAHIMMRIQKPE